MRMPGKCYLKLGTFASIIIGSIMAFNPGLQACSDHDNCIHISSKMIKQFNVISLLGGKQLFTPKRDTNFQQL